jgi:NADH:ubiquinone oxidoreductase subunit E
MSRFNDETKARIDELVARYPNKKAALLPALWVAQEVYGGWLPEEAMAEVAAYLELPPTEVEGVATFYTMYNKKPVGRYHIEVCHNVSCQVFGADDLIHYCEGKLGRRRPTGCLRSTARSAWERAATRSPSRSVASTSRT